MLTRAKRQQVEELIAAYELEKWELRNRQIQSSNSAGGGTFSAAEDDSRDAEVTARMIRQAERAAIKERRLLSCRRTLRYGEQRRILELRFREIGSLQANGLSYGKISRRLYIRPRTIQSVCQAYVRRGGTLRGPY